MKKEMQMQLVSWLRQQAAFENEMIVFNDKMKSESPDFKPLISNESHTAHAARLLEWADAVEGKE